MIVPLVLLLLAAGIGAAVAAIVTSGGGSKATVVTRTVAGPAGRPRPPDGHPRHDRGRAGRRRLRLPRLRPP